MLAVIFDTETNGYKRKYVNGPKPTDKLGRVIQLAWEVADIFTGEVVSKHEYLIKPDGWKIPSVRYFLVQGQTREQAAESARFWIEHGFNTKESEEKGVPMCEVLPLFVQDVNASNLLVAHSLDFDKGVLGNEMIRYGIRAEKRLPGICTMRIGKELGAGSLSDLFKFLFNTTFDGAHNAGADVSACRGILVELVKRGIINPQILTT